MKSITGARGTETQNCPVSGSRNTISLVGKKSTIAPAAPTVSSTEKLSQTLGPDSFVDLLKHSNQSFHLKYNVKSQQRAADTSSNNKIDKIIRKNLRKQKEKDEQKRKEEDAKTMRDLERKQ